MILTIIVFLVILSLLVFVHELGHFLVAKKLGIGVEEFGFGLPPRIWGKKVRETIYSINWLPIGGFVKLAGEEESSVASHQSRIGNKRKLFYARSKKERAVVLLAGVVMNFTLAVGIISYIFTRGVLIPTNRVHIEKILPGTPAQAAGLKINDIITSINGILITQDSQVGQLIRARKGEEIQIIVARDNNTVVLNATPRTQFPENEGPLGIAITNLEEHKYPWYQAPVLGLKEAFKLSWMMVVGIATILWQLVTFQRVTAEVAGPVGIAQITGHAVKLGLLSVLELTGLLSLNLAIVNALPIPALDGGRLLFVVLEKFLGKKVKPQIENIAHQIGMAVLLGFIVLITINDILRIIRS